MKLAKEKITSLGFGVAAGVIGAALSSVFVFFDSTSLDSVIPISIGLAIIIATAHYWKTLQVQSMHDEFSQVKRRLSVLGDGIAETQGLVQLSLGSIPAPQLIDTRTIRNLCHLRLGKCWQRPRSRAGRV